MTAAARTPPVAYVDPLLVFQARAEARALLWQAGEFDLQEAIDELQAAAERDGLVQAIDEDALQSIMNAAFARVGEEPWAPITWAPIMRDCPKSFADACRKADEKQARKTADGRLERLRRLIDDNVSLERAWDEIGAVLLQGRAAHSTVEALMFSLRSGITALGSPATVRRLSELSISQMREVATRLQKFKPDVASAWGDEDVRVLLAAKGKCHAKVR